MEDHSLYIHVPFCTSKCAYCDYPVIVGQLELSTAFVDAVQQELRFILGKMPKLNISTVYIGGGTPSKLPLELLNSFLKGIEREIKEFQSSSGYSASIDSASGGEWTIEVNPEDLGMEMIELLTKNQINRLSIGVQSFSENILSNLNRIHTVEGLEKMFQLLNDHWFGEVNVDLLTSIPGQKRHQVFDAIDKVVDFGVNHVTLLELETSELMHVKLKSSMANDWLSGCERLTKHGFSQYELTHFSRQGLRSNYISHVMQLLPAICLGPSASGVLPSSEVKPFCLDGVHWENVSDRNPVRLTHSNNIHDYLIGPSSRWGLQAELFSAKDYFIELMLSGLRFSEGLSLARIKDQIRPSPEEILSCVWSGWESKGFALPLDEHIKLTLEGRLRLDGLILELIEELESAENISIQFN